MSKATICPVCHGTGKVTKTTVGTAGGTFEVDCHGCGGRGWVEVSDDPMPYVPYYPPYNPPYDPYYPNYPSTTPWYTTTC